MAVNKVVYGDNTLIDLTSDTVDASHLAKDYTAHDKAGNTIIGMLESGCTVKGMVAYGDGTSSLTFTGLSAKPKMLIVQLSQQLQNSTTTAVLNVCVNGDSTYGIYSYQQSNKNAWGQVYQSARYFHWEYSDGTLTVSTDANVIDTSIKVTWADLADSTWSDVDGTKWSELVRLLNAATSGGIFPNGVMYGLIYAY